MKTITALVAIALLAGAAVATYAQDSAPAEEEAEQAEKTTEKKAEKKKKGFDTPSAFKVQTDDKVKASIPKGEILKGIRRADPRDAIPPIYEPKFESLTKADEWIKKDDRVLVFERDKTARAYPIKILNGHEIVNDKIGDFEFAIVY